MTPENATAQERALEALVAASLRSPWKELEVTEEEIKRFVDQQVTLSAEDESALIDSKLKLMQQVRDTLRGRQQVAASELEIPKSLLTLGERKRLMLPQMRMLLNMRLQTIGHRCDSGSVDLESFDWERFYEKVREYIK